MNNELAAVVQQNVFVNCAIVFHREVVAEGDFHAVENLHVLAAMLEYMTSEHSAHSEPEPVIQPHGRAVVHHPKPDQRFALCIFRTIHIAVILGLQAGVTRIEGMDQSLLSGAPFRRSIRLAQVEFMERVAHHIATVLRIAIAEFRIQVLDPSKENIFGLWSRSDLAVFESRHVRPRYKLSNIAQATALKTTRRLGIYLERYNLLLRDCDLMVSHSCRVHAVRKREARVQPQLRIFWLKVLFEEELQYKTRHFNAVQ